jgi:hypothetical protein
MPIDNTLQAQTMLLRQLTLLTRYSLPSADRFILLECLREPLRKVQEISAGKFVGRPLPLTPPRQAALDSTLAIWQAMLINYLHCLAQTTKSRGQPPTLPAVIAQRALATLADWQLDLIRSEYLPDTGYWRQVNQVFANAEAGGFSMTPVKDALRHGPMSVSPLSAYAECHLLHAASPYELTSRDLIWVARWTRRWGPKITLLNAPPEDIRQYAHPLWVDVASDKPASYVPQPAAQGRWLETTALRQSLMSRLDLLAKGHAPAEMQLGSDVVQPAAEQLLSRLLQRWCQGGVKRRHERTEASGTCRLIIGFDAIHFHLRSQDDLRLAVPDTPLRQAEKALPNTAGDSLAQSTLKADIRRVSPAERPSVETWEMTDDWQLQDTSTTGLRITRPIKEGLRIGSGTLVAIQLQGATIFTLGCVRWALRQDDNQLTIGIQLFPGTIEAVSVRKTGLENSSSCPAFLIMPDKTTDESITKIVLPVGRYQPEQIISINRTAPKKNSAAKLTRLLSYGTEFECYAYDSLAQ